MSMEERKVKQSEHKKELIKYIGTCALVSVVVIVLLLVGFGLENSSLPVRLLQGFMIGWVITGAACGIMVGAPRRPGLFGTVPILICFIIAYYSLCMMLGVMLLPLVVILHSIAFLYQTIRIQKLKNSIKQCV